MGGKVEPSSAQSKPCQPTTRDRRALGLFRPREKANTTTAGVGNKMQKHLPDKVRRPQAVGDSSTSRAGGCPPAFWRSFRVRGDQESVSGRLQTKCVACRVMVGIEWRHARGNLRRDHCPKTPRTA